MKKGILILFTLMAFFMVDSEKGYAFGDGILASKEGYIVELDGLDSNCFNNILEFETQDACSFTPAPSKPGTLRIIFDDLININEIKLKGSNYLSSVNELNFYDSDNKLIDSVQFYTQGSIMTKNVNLKNVKSFDTKQIYGNSNAPKIFAMEFYGDVKTYDSVSALSAEISYNNVILSWLNPNAIDFRSVEVYENGIYRKTVNKPSNSAKIDGLKPETEYTFKAIAVYEDGGKSADRTITVTTLPEPEHVYEVINLKANATHERVDLSWQLPQYETFSHVNIYRDKIKKEPSAMSKMLFGSTAYANNPTKIFETNGTYFNDLTVEPDTTYDYLLTTESKSGEESDGLITQVTTASAPPPTMGGVVGSENENGDYTINWTKPTEGQVKIIVGGKEYAIVPASDKTFTVPADDVKYTMLGNPDVKVQAIGTDGQTGPTTKPPSGGGVIGSGDLPFGISELVAGGMELFRLVAPFVILGLSFILVPRIVAMIRNSFSNNKNKEVVAGRRTG